MRGRAITHVIYDMDGLLLDTERFYTEATRLIVRKYGKEFDWGLKARMIGKKAIDSATILTQALELPVTPAEYLRERAVLLDRLFPAAEPLPGATRLTEHLHLHGIPQAIATSSDRKAFELKTARHKSWLRCFSCLVCGDDPEVRHGKPAPDIFLTAAARLHAPPAQCLVFEDSPAGIEAAHAAGMPVVAVPDSNLDSRAFAAADLIVPSLAEFDPSSWGLPLFP